MGLRVITTDFAFGRHGRMSNLYKQCRTLFWRRDVCTSSSSMSSPARYPVQKDGRTTVHVLNSLTAAHDRRSAKKEPLLLMNKNVATWYTLIVHY